MAVSLGGVQWIFNVNYTGKQAVGEATKDLGNLQQVTREVTKAQKELEQAERDAAKAAKESAKAQAELAAAQRTLKQLKGLGSAGSPALLRVQAVAQQNVAEAQQRATTTANTYATAQQGVTAAAANYTKAAQNVSKVQNTLVSQTGSLNSAVMALAAAFGSIKLLAFIDDSVKLAARVENLGTVLKNVGATAGYSRGQLGLLESQITKLGITTQNARKDLALLAQGEIDLAVGAKLSRIAQDAAVIAGLNSSQAFNRMVIAIQRTNTWMLRNLGILVNLNNLYRDFAQKTGRVVTTLSSHEKQQILINEVMRKGTIIQGTYEAALGDVFKRFTSLERVWEEAARMFGESFIPIFEVLVDTTTAFLKWWTALPGHIRNVIAAVTASTIVFVAATAAIHAMTLAIVALKAASGNITGALVGLTAVIVSATGAGVFFAATLRTLRREHEAHITALLEEEARLITLSRAIIALDAIEQQWRATGEETRDNRLEINKIISDSIALLPEYADEIRAFLNAETFADQGRAGGLAIFLSTLDAGHGEETMARLQRLREELETELARPLDIPDAGTGRGIGPGMLIEQQLQHREDLRIRIQGIDAAMLGERVQHFKKLQQAQDVALTLAQRTLKMHQNAKSQIWNEANLKHLHEFEQTLTNQTNAVMSHAAIERNIEDEKKHIAAGINENLAKEVERLGSNQEKIAEAELRASSTIGARWAELDEEEERLKDQADKIAEAAELAPDILALRLQRQQMENKTRLDALASEEAGEDKRLSELQRKMDQLENKKTDSLKEYANEAERFAKEKAVLEGRIASTTNEETVRGYQESLEKQKELLAVSIELREQMLANHAVDVLEIEADIARRQEEIRETRIEEDRKMHSKLEALERRLIDVKLRLQQKLANERIKAAERVLDAEDKAIKAQEKILKGIEGRRKADAKAGKEAIEMRREFGKLLAKGVPARRAQAIVAMKHGDTVGENRFQARLARAQDNLQDRKDAVEEKREELRALQQRNHEARVKAGIAKAKEQRDKIIDEIHDLRLEIAGHPGGGEAPKTEEEKQEALDALMEQGGGPPGDAPPPGLNPPPPPPPPPTPVQEWAEAHKDDPIFKRGGAALEAAGGLEESNDWWAAQIPFIEAERERIQSERFAGSTGAGNLNARRAARAAAQRGQAQNDTDEANAEFGIALADAEVEVAAVAVALQEKIDAAQEEFARNFEAQGL